MSSKKIIIANWKQNGSLRSLQSLMSQVIKALKLKSISHSVVILPPYVYLPMLSEQIRSNKNPRNLFIGVQNISAFSGKSAKFRHNFINIEHTTTLIAENILCF